MLLPVSSQVLLAEGEVVAARDPLLVSLVLGSAVAVALWDRSGRTGGICCYRRPRWVRGRGDGPSTRYGNVAITVLIRLLTGHGASRATLEAQIFGGAARRSPSHRVVWDGLGRQNVEVARQILRRHGIPIVSEDVGGVLGRKLSYHTGCNEVIIAKVARLRRADWLLEDATGDA